VYLQLSEARDTHVGVLVRTSYDVPAADVLYCLSLLENLDTGLRATMTYMDENEVESQIEIHPYRYRRAML
jgi:hypothetical protein